MKVQEQEDMSTAVYSVKKAIYVAMTPLKEGRHLLPYNFQNQCWLSKNSYVRLKPVESC